MLHQGTLQFERTDAVIGALEDVVAAAYKEEVAIFVDERLIAGVIEPVSHGGLAEVGIVHVSNHQPGRARLQSDGDLALIPLAVLQIDSGNSISGKRAAHTACLNLLPRRIADHGGGFGLAVAVADG